MAERTRALYDKLGSPAATELTATFSAPGAEVTPDLYRGEPLVFAARLPSLEGTVIVPDWVGGQLLTRTLPLAEVAAGTGISKARGRSRIGETETARITGHQAPDAADVEILVLALEHGLTSLVAIDATPRRPAGTPIVAADLPLNLTAGWDFAKVFNRARTATLAPNREANSRLMPIATVGEGIAVPQTGLVFLPQLGPGLLLALAVSCGLEASWRQAGCEPTGQIWAPSSAGSAIPPRRCLRSGTGSQPLKHPGPIRGLTTSRRTAGSRC